MTDSMPTFFANDYKLGHAGSPAIKMDDVVITFIGYGDDVQHVKLSRKVAEALASEISSGREP